MNVDILGIGETHLVNQSGINIDGYQWIGHNRKNIHVRAKCGSGGVGVLVRSEIYNAFNISIVDNDTEGILWIKLQDKFCRSNIFFVAVVYLPPENSCRAVDVHEFMETLMTQIYTIPNGHLFYICGDLNSRCADFSDFIEGVDELPERHVDDFHHNSYGTIFCDFLIDVNCCILNGRNSLHNDYTFISIRGCSVVDYCIAPYEQLERFTDFYVHRATELVRQTGVADNFDLRTIVPDHSFLTWNVNLKFAFSDEGISRIYEPKRKIKYDTQNIPQDWLLDHDIIEKIANIIRRLENGENTQVSVDSLYENF